MSSDWAPEMTCECGLSFVQGLEEDELLHQQAHREYEAGPELPVVHSLVACDTIDGLSVYHIDRLIPQPVRQELAHVALVAHRSMPGFKSGYDGSVTEDDQRLFLLADGSRVVAMVLTAMEEFFWHIGWDDTGRPKLLNDAQVERRGPKVGRVWVAAGYRRKIVRSSPRYRACCVLGWRRMRLDGRFR